MVILLVPGLPLTVAAFRSMISVLPGFSATDVVA